jgi:hypothetical protein
MREETKYVSGYECNCMPFDGDCAYCLRKREEDQLELEALRAWKEKARPYIGRVALSIQNVILDLESLHNKKLLEENNNQDVDRLIRLLEPLYRDAKELTELLKEGE